MHPTHQERRLGDQSRLHNCEHLILERGPVRLRVLQDALDHCERVHGDSLEARLRARPVILRGLAGVALVKRLLELLRLQEREVCIGGLLGVIVRKRAVKQLREHAPERTILRVVLAVLVAPRGQVVRWWGDQLGGKGKGEWCLRVNSTVMKRSPRVKHTASAKIAREMV